MTNEESIQIKSLRERLMLKEIILDSIKGGMIRYTDYKGNDKYDASWWLETTSSIFTVVCEVKVREYPLTAYNGWLIEKDKYDYLMSRKEELKLYINFHPDGYQIWDLATCTQPTWFKKEERANNYNTNTRVKTLGDLSSTEATIIKRDLNLTKYLERANNILINKKQNENK